MQVKNQTKMSYQPVSSVKKQKESLINEINKAEILS